MDGSRASAPVRFVLNGQEVTATPEPGERLSRALRERLGARDVKVGCDKGDCGACTVLIDGRAVCSCMTAAQQAGGRVVDTLSGLVAGDPVTTRLAQSFARHGAVQCGICTPGMMVAATALLRRDPAPSRAAIEDALGGVLCRCTGYGKIVAAVADALSDAPDTPTQSGVGAAIPRRDARAKTHGTERFGDDIAAPGTLEVRVIRSPHAAARFAFGDLDAFAAAHGIEAVLTARDVPGEPTFGVIPGFFDQPVFAEGHVRFRGEAIAAIVAEPEVMARFRDSDVPVEWTPTEPAMAPDAALSAPDIHDARPGNVMCRGKVVRGDAEAGLARAAATVSGRFRTAFVEHAPIEPEAGWAEMVEGRLHLAACTQAPHMDREALARILGLPVERIRILPAATGGGFGAKIDLSVQPYLALAAIRTQRPVRLTYSREESFTSTTKRHPAEIELTLGADAEGRFTGIRFQGDFDTGAYASWGPTVANRVPIHASGPYLVPDYAAHSRAIYTNNPPSGAFRGFGVPQSAIALEVLIDELAGQLGLDPLEVRLRNALRNGEPTVCGQVFETGVGIADCFEALRPHWTRERADAESFNATATTTVRGVGLAGGWYGCGNTSLPNPSTIRAGVTPEGRIVLHQGAADIGQGADTVIPQIFADALGCDLGQIDVAGYDTDATPDAGKTSASRQTFITGKAAWAAGRALRAEILKRVNAGDDARLTVDAQGLAVTDHGRTLRLNLPPGDPYAFEVSETYDPPTEPLDANGQGAPYAQYGYAAHLAVVEVDRALGLTRVLRMVAAHDAGTVINPLLASGQVEGGIAQGLGMALMEEYVSGRTDNLHDYLIPTIGDVAPVETIWIETQDPHGPFGAKGLGEHALIPTAPAILNAIAHATGIRPRRVPMTPARLWAAMREAT